MKHPYFYHFWRAVAICLLVSLPLRTFSQLYLDSTASVADRVTDLLGRMTLDEKIGQMVQTERNFNNISSTITTYFLGSVLSGGGSAPAGNNAQAWVSMYNAMQQAALATRLKIPIIYGVDAVHGHNNVYGATIFPHNIGLGCTRDTLLVAACARATASEVRATGLNWTFSPCIAVPRDLRWGRTYEGFGETTEIQEMMARAAVLGYQGDSLGATGGILGCAKHFIGDGGTSGGVDQGNTVLTEAQLRALHLPGYIKAIEAGVGSVMISFNRWNGSYCHGNTYLVTTLLKGELGFKGIVVSDWEGVKYLSSDFKTAVKLSVNAGLDMFMEPYQPLTFISKLKELVNSGEVPTARINDAVSRILTVKFQMGLFEHPMAVAQQDSLGSAEHRAIARQAVRQSQVLLKNTNNLLPLSKTSGKILVAGSKANDLGSQCGGWTISWQGSTGAITQGTTILSAIQGVRGANEVVYSSNGITSQPVTLAVVVVGETPYAEGAGDSQTLTLSQTDLLTISTVKAKNIPYVVVLLSGRPMIVSDVIADADAFVAAWLPGTEGQGITDVLFGDYPFSGKLSHTWPSSISQEPINQGVSPYYPLYPYGYGLTTTVGTEPTVAPAFLSVYPNPAQNRLIVSADQLGRLEIRDIAGALVYSQILEQAVSDIDVSALAGGMYAVSLVTAKGSTTVKWIKE